MPEIPLEGFIDVGSNPQGPHLKDFGVVEGSRIRFEVARKGPDEILGLSAARPDKNSTSPVDLAENPLFRDEFFSITILYLFHLPGFFVFLHRGSPFVLRNRNPFWCFLSVSPFYTIFVWYPSRLNVKPLNGHFVLDK